jgi:hypothetical protein
MDFSQIKTGDILGVSCDGFFWSIVKQVQRAGGLYGFYQYTHIGVAYWADDVLYSVEMDGEDNVMRPLTQHINLGREVAVFPSPVGTDAMKAQFAKATADSISYAWLDYISIGLRMIFGVHVGFDPDTSSDMVCSTFASRWLQWAGWKAPATLPAVASPAELCKALGTPGIILNKV